MKIIHLILGKANPNRMNGVNRAVNNLATYQTLAGYQTEVWGITSSTEKNYPDRNYSTRLFLPGSYKFLLHDSLRTAIAEQAQQGSVGFHLHGAFIPAFFTAARLLQRYRLPYLYTPHGAFNAIALKKNKLIKSIYFSLFEKNILRHAKGVHLLGQSEYDNTQSLLPLSNQFLLPNGQNFDELQFEPQAMGEVTHPLFGFCGRLDIYYKGLDLLLQAFATYRQQGGKALLWLIGDGPDRPELEKQAAALHISQHITFWGSKFGQEKLRLISQMDAFVHPSRSEGSPTAVIEALALRVPCLVSTGTNVGPLVEQYNSGLHLAQNTPEHICQALHQLEQLYHRQELKEKGNNGRRMVEEHFDWHKIGKALAERLMG